jgi:hypothetical protein
MMTNIVAIRKLLNVQNLHTFNGVFTSELQEFKKTTGRRIFLTPTDQTGAAL